jgi:hypothetical protein
MTTEQLAEKIIKELLDAGYSYDEMPAVLQLARKKYRELKKHGRN